MGKKLSNYMKAAVCINLMTVGIVVAVLVMVQTTQPLVEQTIIRENKAVLAWLGDPAGDTSGFCGFYHYPYQADPATAYASNLSTATAYEYITSLSGEMTGETPHSTTHDYVIKIVVNDTIGYNTSSSLWEPSWIYMNMSMDYDFGSDIDWTNMTLVEITNNTDFCWYNGYINNNGAGYTLAQNQKTNASLNCTVWY